MRPPNTRMVIAHPINEGDAVEIVANGSKRIGTVETKDATGTVLTVRLPDGERHAVHLWRVRAA